ncbi:MAG TPA: methyltransferase domain-containing protein [Terriglobales bacterium]|nr:methyltransferase domain-containing protein [Terriglobales bacterium]
MTVDEFYRLLFCPACKGDLTLQNAATQFYCSACSYTFPIIDGIPVLMPCNVVENMDRLFGRYWDSVTRATMYDAEVEGTDIFGVHNHTSEMQGLLRYLDPTKLDPILDAGCGNGRFLAALPAETPSVGLDASLNLLRIARSKKRGQFHVCAELEHLPFRDGQFGTVISCRVLQHLVKQEDAIHELCRVVRKQGSVVLELYNQWNLKTVYKNIRMSRWHKVFNLPFRLVLRSMSPFDHWGLAYDHYNNWFETKRWLRESGMQEFEGRGVGFGFHKYFFEPLYINAVAQKHWPRALQRYYDSCLWFERHFGMVVPWRYTMEKFVIRAVKEA